MAKNNNRAIGLCLLGVGMSLAVGSINHLYRQSVQAAKYREILAPLLATAPDRVFYSTGTEDLNQKSVLQIPADVAFELKFLQISSEGGSDAGTTLIFAIGALMLMGIGMRLTVSPECNTANKQQAEQGSDGNPHEPFCFR